MTKTLNLAFEKASALPDETQEQLGREILLRIDSIKKLRAELEVGIDELEAGLGEEIDLAEVLRRARKRA